MFSKKLSAILLIGLALLSSACKENELQFSDAEKASLTNVIIGEDDREKTYNHPSELGRSTGLILGRHPDGGFYTCTGTILNESYVLTAAHCVFNRVTKKPYVDIFFIPRTLYRNQMPFGRFPVDKVYLPNAYRSFTGSSFQSTKFDIAVVKFFSNTKGEDLLEKTGGGIGFWGLETSIHPEVTTIGYPGDKPSWTPYKEEDCSLLEYNKYIYTTTCDVYSGQSGSSYVAYSNTYKKSYIHGVQSTESTESQLNLVTKITPTRQNIITNIIRGNTYSALNDKEDWVEMKAYVSRGVNVIIENACRNRKTLYGAIVYQKEDGSTYNKVREIKPGHSINLGLVPNKEYQLGLKFKNGGQVSFTDKRASVAYRYSSYGVIDVFDYKVSSTGDVRYEIGDCN